MPVTSSGSTTNITLNTGYFKKPQGLLKLLELFLGLICVIMVSWSYSTYYRYVIGGELLFLLMSVTFFIGTAIMILSYVLSFSAGGIIEKTNYELIYNSIAFILYLFASIFFMAGINSYYSGSKGYPLYITGSIIGLVVSILYLASAILAYRTYKGN